MRVGAGTGNTGNTGAEQVQVHVPSGEPPDPTSHHGVLALTGQASVEHDYSRNYDSRVLRPHKAVGTMAIWLAGNATSSALLQMYKLPSL